MLAGEMLRVMGFWGRFGIRGASIGSLCAMAALETCILGWRETEMLLGIVSTDVLNGAMAGARRNCTTGWVLLAAISWGWTVGGTGPFFPLVKTWIFNQYFR